jgi:hypothetical protein
MFRIAPFKLFYGGDIYPDIGGLMKSLILTIVIFSFHFQALADLTKSEYVIDTYESLPSQTWLLKPRDSYEPELESCNFLHEGITNRNGIYSSRRYLALTSQKIGFFLDSSNSKMVTFFQQCKLPDGSKGIVKRSIQATRLDLLKDSISFESGLKKPIGTTEYWAEYQFLIFNYTDLSNTSDVIPASYYHLEQNCSQGRGGSACVEYPYRENLKFVIVQ